MLAVHKDGAYPALHLLSCLLNLGSLYRFPTTHWLRRAQVKHTVTVDPMHMCPCGSGRDRAPVNTVQLCDPCSYSTPPLSHIGLQIPSTGHKEEEVYSVQQLGSIKSTSSIFLHLQVCVYSYELLWLEWDGNNSHSISPCTCLKSTEILSNLS